MEKYHYTCQNPEYRQNIAPDRDLRLTCKEMGEGQH